MKTVDGKMALFMCLTMSLLSCEGFKVLTLYNVSDSPALITYKLDSTALLNSPAHLVSDSFPPNSFQHVLEPDSSMNLVFTFTGMMPRVKILERDLMFTYLRLESPYDTIVAHSKKEILHLLKDPRTRYRARTDKERVTHNGKNFGNIFIRQ